MDLCIPIGFSVTKITGGNIMRLGGFGSKKYDIENIFNCSLNKFQKKMKIQKSHFYMIAMIKNDILKTICMYYLVRVNTNLDTE